ncbi:helix-turn-helix transcriptional regulator [uncultured Bacteroides sp.]|uniref:helix-turn-helix domain-containing protein n=1 Tax=uncultured Bacteroides sp. TaxID=162156 RepID=UPI0026084813|nr:helix-turn-helix transcriptional regulator [uncultured Bacteroides sp.]
MSSIKDRFKMIMEREKLTAGAFAESIGVAQATISHILGPRNKYPSTEVILRLHQRYNDINLEWLLTGKGEMCNGTEPTASIEEGQFDYPLFAENAENPSNATEHSEKRKEMTLEMAVNTPKEVVKQEIIYKERPPRKITEIRIFFDDNTYETFKPEK